jgi:hypothetical protein
VTQADKVILANDDLLPLNPDPALNYEGINNDTIEPYRYIRCIFGGWYLRYGSIVSLLIPS